MDLELGGHSQSHCDPLGFWVLPSGIEGATPPLSTGVSLVPLDALGNPLGVRDVVATGGALSGHVTITLALETPG